MRFLALAAFLPALALGAAAVAETAISTESRSGLAVTIYNGDLALVRDSRGVDLAAGENDLAFLDVAAAIQPETALLTSPKGKISVIEQNFDFDLLTPQVLLEKSVGKTIRIIRSHPTTGAESSEVAEVLSVADGQAVLKVGDRIETAIPGRLVFSTVPENLRARPTLVVKVRSETAGRLPLDLSYITHGLGWTADYVAELSPDESTIDLNGWVTLTNQSGVAYEDAKLQLVAGSVNRVMPPQPRLQTMMGEMAKPAAPAPDMVEEAAFEYHLYSLARPTTIRQNQTKQVALLSAARIPVEKQYLFTNAGNVWSYYNSDFGETRPVNATVRLKFKNETASNLGLPLPAGVIRLYGKDSDGDAIFLGEDRIQHTPKNERVDLTLGQAFDVTARIKALSQEEIGDSVYENEYEVEFKNAKARAVTVDMREAIPGEWEILKESHAHERLDAHTAAWRIEVPAEGSVKLTYKVRIRL